MYGYKRARRNIYDARLYYTDFGSVCHGITMKNVTIGTAGHVDHGKTTLIAALTGIDTDRLKEEKERGMTIDLGFAPLKLPNGLVAGIVDVPGHERFIKNMLAGAGGVDVALLVVAADESVMPQTVEHLDILQLLEVKRGVVALTKSDMVDEEWIEAVKEDVRKALDQTFLADAPVIPVSGVTGQGLPDLLNALTEIVEEVEARDSAGSFRLPIDRVFTMTGFGTVVTGTLVTGVLKIDGQVEIMPKGLGSRIRGLQLHGKKVDSVSAGTRIAVNLAGVEVGELTRGDVCATPGTLKASNLFDLKLNLLKTAPKPLKNGARVRLHVGTAELLGRLVLLDRDELQPGEQSYAQFRSEERAACAKGDHFVIRRYSPMVTVGGGVVVDPVPRRHKRFDVSVISSLETSSQGTPEELLEQTLKRSSVGMSFNELEKASVLPEIAGLVESLKADGRIVELPGGRLIHSHTLSELAGRVENAMKAFHARNPMKPGMQREELRTMTARQFDNRSFSAILTHLSGTGLIEASDTVVRLPDHEVTLDPQQESAAQMILQELRRSGMNVPSQDELLGMTGMHPTAAREILDLLIQRGEIVRIDENLCLHASTVTKAESMLREFLENNGKITVSQFRDLTGSSRKYALPLLEHFDSKRVTRRVGDERVLARTGSA